MYLFAACHTRNLGRRVYTAGGAIWKQVQYEGLLRSLMVAQPAACGVGLRQFFGGPSRLDSVPDEGRVAGLLASLFWMI